MTVTLKGSGTYILLLRLEKRSNIAVGQNRQFSLKPALYFYVGSAHGPGGLFARLRRHTSVSTNKHWHIDYLLPHTKIIGALVREDKRYLECTWASWLNQTKASCVERFGASDCKCKGHLFCLDLLENEADFISHIHNSLHAHFIPTNSLR